MDSYEDLKKEINLAVANDLEALAVSLDRANSTTVGRIWELLDLFTGFFSSLLPQDERFKKVSAFAIYNIECAHLLRRATIETFSSYYGVGHTLLRSAFEALVRGAFWECMAHRQFRETVKRGRFRGMRINGETKTIVDWLEDVIRHSPEAGRALETVSAGIFDKIGPSFGDPLLKRVPPALRPMAEQIADWKVLKPMEEPVASIYDFLYSELSDYAHLIPDRTLIGSRFVAGKPILPAVEFNIEELDSFCGALSCVVDIGLLMILNLSAGILGSDCLNREWLGERIKTIQTLLPELFSARLAQSLISGGTC